MLKLKNSKLKTLILESFLIILSVMLGLLGNDLRESINKNHDAEFAIVNVKNEIRENEKELTKSIEKQKAVYKYFDELLRKHNFFEKSKKSFHLKRLLTKHRDNRKFQL